MIARSRSGFLSTLDGEPLRGELRPPRAKLAAFAAAFMRQAISCVPLPWC